MSAPSCSPEFLRALATSFRHWTGRDLVPEPESDDQLRSSLDSLPAVIVAHNRDPDPTFVYANDLACQLWEMPKSELVGMPSRLTAEPMHRDERAQLLARTQAHGFVDDYRGIRITARGKRFRIEQALLWNILDARGELIGQAATFDQWTWLDEPGLEARA